jgi:hypothetical protein
LFPIEIDIAFFALEGSLSQCGKDTIDPFFCLDVFESPEFVLELFQAAIVINLTLMHRLTQG